MFSKGKLVKLTITAYQDEKFKEQQGEPMEALINPEGYKETFTVKYDEAQPAGNQGNAPKFNKITPGEFTFRLLFDSTGVFSSIDSLDDALNSIADNISAFVPSFLSSDADEVDRGVFDEIEKFKELTISFNGSTHQNNSLIIAWGALIVKCKLTKLDIEYKLFNASGYPIRAVATIGCINTISDEERKALENKQSPDLTHIRYAQAGDTLPLMTYRIYGNPFYYLEVAKANKLQNFRKLKAGQKIIFPPIQKN
ncbi:LysM peptidoglycan-binding domain-containing protein [Aquimarina sp. RZ0]|uniref:CIS tube protein n=1 Tax=Aquimarina sp. RZ0 TaxID=2607730 RepID=UPI0011F3B4F7|nr:LysM peptidoglycan-binding domain-containing protein [Aquimarina sp. RZ0]KAA1248055.1 LysM peptidoglycan-binding domain-containing protein [Aquimarina sp. RZ0]